MRSFQRVEYMPGNQRKQSLSEIVVDRIGLAVAWVYDQWLRRFG
jgi:hypothetical protein